MRNIQSPIVFISGIVLGSVAGVCGYLYFDGSDIQRIRNQQSPIGLMSVEVKDKNGTYWISKEEHSRNTLLMTVAVIGLIGGLVCIGLGKYGNVFVNKENV